MPRAVRSVLAHASRWVAAAAVLLVPGCLSPTLPLPPPDPPDYMAADAADPGLWRLGGTATAGGIVLIRNERTGVITGTEATSGKYLVTVAAERCDGASVFEVLGTHASDAGYFVVRETVNGVAQGDPCPSP